MAKQNHDESITSPEKAAPAFAPSSRRDQCVRDIDVVVVGAGLSGLQAATDVQGAGFSCVVLEAMDRVGGKTLSTTKYG